MADLETQLHSYASALLDGFEPVSTEEITEGIPTPRAGRSRRMLGAVLAVALVTTLTVGAALWLTGHGNGVRIASGGHPSGAPTSWTRVDALQSAQVAAFASSAHGVVAVGSGIWFSSDGRTWTSVFDSTGLGGGPAGQQGSINSVTVGGPGFVAAGQAVDPISGQAVAAIWTSPDGQHWARVRDPALEPPTPPIPAGNSTPIRGSIQAIARGGPGLVAVGGVFAGSFVGNTLVTAPYDIAIWTSKDGAHWTRVDTRALYFGGGGSVQASLNSIIAHDRSMIATGTDAGSTVVFESRDGTHWQHVAVVPGSFSQMTVYRHLLVAVGNDGGTSDSTERGIIWTSTDARHWHQTLVSQPAPFAVYRGVATTGQSLVVAGSRGRYEPILDATLAVSSNARTWRLVPQNGDTFAARTSLGPITTIGSHYLVTGVDNTIGTGTANDPYRPRTVLFISD
jgi:hypothetical protein